MSKNRVSIKVASSAGFLSGQSRRQDALDRQQRQRQALTIGRRQSLIEAVITAPIPTESEKPIFHHDIICEIPDWMVDIPVDLSTNWSVVIRPEGQRCIATSRYGRTIIRSIEGRYLNQVQTVLPNGSQKSGTSDQATLVECILQDRYLFVMDVLCWKGYHLSNSPREFRQYWMQTKIREVTISSDPDHDLETIPLFAKPCTIESVSAAYNGFDSSSGACSDGIAFYHNASVYTAGCTPLSLLWKDANCSRYLIEGDPAAKQQIILHCDPSTGIVATEDQVALGVLNPANLGADANKLQRFTIDAVDVSMQTPAVVNLVHIGSCPAAKIIAHSWTKIVFQFAARFGRSFVTIELLLDHLSKAAQSNFP